MHKLNSKLLLVAGLTALLMAGCGGGGGGGFNAGNISQSTSALFAYITDLIAGTSDMSEPVDINGLTLATDDAAEPTPLN